MAYLTKAPLVLVKVPAVGGDDYRVDYHYAGSVIPWLSEEQRERFVSEGHVEELADSAVAPELRVPKKTASQADWVAYAANVHAADPVEASKLTKQDLIDLYGG